MFNEGCREKKHKKQGEEENNILCFDAFLCCPEELGGITVSSAPDGRSTSHRKEVGGIRVMQITGVFLHAVPKDLTLTWCL